MDVIGDLMARDRRSDRLALRVDGPGRTYTYHDLITTSYKAGNVLRYLGVRKGARVAVDPVSLPEPLLTFLGAAQLGAVTAFDPAVEARATVVAVDRETEFADLPPGQKLAVFGGPPSSPATTHWEQEVWSENPAVHPEVVAPDDPALVADDREFTHGDLLDAAREVVADFDLGVDDTVAVRSSLSHPGTVVAGVLAPLLAGGTIRIPAGDEAVEAALAVGDGVPESVALAPDDAC
ncbi:acetyl-CoA synthetase [Haloferax sp. Atlit-10N]|uniref:Acetyl-CoA synthetase n=1 Tax=Haloferax prahovense (strain DSM 18310 / JCM 13924 / TL6) TaxID=1227461 RepID=M0GFU4_HALPT|nr:MULTISPECIES: AMP-binding protein [Haloferax]ELZ70418.1 putative acetyl-CoA synthetase [Haloferax prahovense DSM 18310]RDZ47283.1 acetyl-CoA synthetase [Haloferax sp. Atlit-16N]RDZ61117.1 acetyl-CoA synthetase [Haloferax sp. Atlit-10N]